MYKQMILNLFLFAANAKSASQLIAYILSSPHQSMCIEDHVQSSGRCQTKKTKKKTTLVGAPLFQMLFSKALANYFGRVVFVI